MVQSMQLNTEARPMNFDLAVTSALNAKQLDAQTLTVTVPTNLNTED